MELTVREVATLLDVSVRTVRGRLARGDLPGRKVRGTWRIRREHVPLTERQRGQLQRKADAVRQAVEAALPSRMATTPGDRRRRLADVDAFRLGAALLREIRGKDAPLSANGDTAARLEHSLHQLAEGVWQYDRDLKLAALNRARAGLARLVASLLLAEGDPPSEPVLRCLDRLEGEILPALAGYARWADRLGRSREGRDR